MRTPKSVSSRRRPPHSSHITANAELNGARHEGSGG